MKSLCTYKIPRQFRNLYQPSYKMKTIYGRLRKGLERPGYFQLFHSTRATWSVISQFTRATARCASADHRRDSASFSYCRAQFFRSNYHEIVNGARGDCLCDLWRQRCSNFGVIFVDSKESLLRVRAASEKALREGPRGRHCESFSSKGITV